MQIAVVYIYPLLNIRKYFPLAKRFADTWKEHAPGADCQLFVIANGYDPGPMEMRPFQGIEHTVKAYNNVGWDIGAFLWAAQNIPCDLIVCLGAPVHFWRPGWLAKIRDAYVDNGIGLYGQVCYTGCLPHVRTTSFWAPPQLLTTYPYEIGSARASRYDFEHGPHSILWHARSAGFEVYMVTWDGIFTEDRWDGNVPDERNILMYDQHCYRTIKR